MQRPSVIRHTRDFLPDQVDIHQIPHLNRRLVSQQISDSFIALRSFQPNNNYVDYFVANENIDNLDYGLFLRDIEEKLENILLFELERKFSIKSNLIMVCTYVNNLDVKMTFAYHTKNSHITNSEDVSEHLANQFAKLEADVVNRQLQGSGWVLNSINYVECRISKLIYLPGRGKVNIPKFISDKKAVLNIESDTFCFKYSILAQVCLKKYGRISKKKMKICEKDFNFSIPFPVDLAGIKKFCTLNKCSVCVFGVHKKNFYPILLCKKVMNMHFNLLYLENVNSAHYCLITNLSRLLRSQVFSHESKRFFCMKCMLHFSSEEKLSVHTNACNNPRAISIKLPDVQDYFCFKKFDAVQQNHIIMAMDIEAILKNLHTSLPDPAKSYTCPTQKHIACSFGAYLWSDLPETEIPYLPTGYVSKICDSQLAFDDAVESYFLKVADAMQKFLKLDYKIDYTCDDRKSFEMANTCYICNKPFTCSSEKAMDHDHKIRFNNYRGAAHKQCNILARKQSYVPVYIHALANYDAHFLVKLFCRKKYNIKLIPCNLEKYLSFSVSIKGVLFNFLDSFRLFNAKLSNITAALADEKYIITKQNFPQNVHHLLTVKSPFPYSFLSDVSQLDRTDFPDKSYFRNDLACGNDCDISDAEYQRAKDIWIACNCHTFRDFLDIYQKSDVLMLIDCILSFRKIIFDTFHLEISAFLTTPHLAINCMLRFTGVKLEIFTAAQTEMHDLVSRSIYGGLTMSCLRHEKASNENKLFFYDCNSMYAVCMQNNKLPIGDYKFVSAHDFDWRSSNSDGDRGYMLEVDLSFPKECHDLLSDFPPVCERKIPPGTDITTTRLISDLTCKKNYVLSLAHLQLIAQLGVTIERVHTVLSFQQSAFMKDFITVLEKYRREAKHTCDSNIFKLIANSIYGKFLERLENRRRIKIFSEDNSKLQRCVRKGTFLDRHIFTFPDEDFQMMLVEISAGVIHQNRPILVGAMILSLSKILMLNFWYKVLKPNFQSISLILMDTDSFLFSIKTSDFVRDVQPIKHHFDFSNLQPTHPLYSTKNAKKYGLFKDELGGIEPLEIVTPCSKVYSILLPNSEVKKLKGVQKSFVKNMMKFEHFKNCVLEKKSTMANFNNIISKEHNLYTANVQKSALRAIDYKRVVLADGIHTLPYGHYLLSTERNT
jgi:hypothetical protein